MYGNRLVDESLLKAIHKLDGSGVCRSRGLFELARDTDVENLILIF